MEDNLIGAVCSIFEAESLLLHTSPHHDFPLFLVTNWERITSAFDSLTFPQIEPNDYPKLDIVSQREVELIPTTEFYDMWMSNVVEISLERMHPFVTCALVAHKQIELSRDVLALNFLLSNYAEIKSRTSKLGYKCLKSWMNFYHGRRCGSPEISSSVAGACERIKSRIAKALPHNFCMPEADTIFFGNVTDKALEHLQEYLKYLKYPHEIETYNGGIFWGRKKYLLLDKSGNVILNGIERATF